MSANMHHDDYDERYTDPELRRRLKGEIMAGDRGGEPGRWSARKSQLLAREYEKHGGGYKGERKSDEARHLDEWTAQDWQTEHGDDRARHEDGTTERYLPREVWERLSDKEKREAEKAKQEASKHGEQRAPYTAAVKRAFHELEHGDEEHHADTKGNLYEEAKRQEIPGRSKMSKEELAKALRQSR